eukprot:6190239-Pleurochrysis_carterae.AAC.4
MLRRDSAWFARGSAVERKGEWMRVTERSEGMSECVRKRARACASAFVSASFRECVRACMHD